MKYLLALGVLLSTLFFGSLNVSAATCPLTSGKAYKTAQNPATYYIRSDCKKQLLNHDQYFSYFDSWNDTLLTSAATLASVKTDTAPTVFGPHYFPRTGSVVKSPTDSSVYFTFWFGKIKIASEQLFNDMGLRWEWVETIPQATLDKLVSGGDDLTSTDQVFKEGVYLFRYSDSPNKLHLLLPDIKTGLVQRHLLKNDDLVDYVGYRRDRIPMLSPIYQFKIGSPIENFQEFFMSYLTDAFGQMSPSLFDLGLDQESTVFPNFDTNFDNFDTIDTIPLDQWENWDTTSTEDIFPIIDDSSSYVPLAIQYAPVDSNIDHIFGNEKAQITLIEYSDLECPYCKQFQSTLKQVMEKYPQKIRLVYRHLPLDFHTQARSEALASECAGEQGKFFPFIDRIFAETASNDTLNLENLSTYAREVGVDVPTFNQCYRSEKYAEKINRDIDDAWNAGAYGTPYSLLLGPKGEVIPVNGAVSFEELDAEIQKLF